MSIANPYTPGAGFVPAYLAGREEAIIDAEKKLLSLKKRFPQQSVIYYGLRGVGKTVLLNKIEEIAEEHDILYDHIEVKEKGGFLAQITNTSLKFLRTISTKEKAKDFVRKAQMAIQTLSLTFSPEEGAFSVGMGEIHPMVKSEDALADNLTDVFLALGSAANRTGDTICIFIDEIQYLKKYELEALVNAIHRVNQKRLPIMIYGAGLPKIFKELGEAKSYSERLFVFERVDALNPEEAWLAICEPAKELGKIYEKSAVERIIEITGGYPYFIQEFCSIVWDEAEAADEISSDMVRMAERTFFEHLDQGFFKVRYERCTQKEREFMYAMVKCGDLPCNIANVAKILGCKVNSISPVRAQLISKGLIYATGHAEIDFTVPQFDNYIKRILNKKEGGN